MSLTWLGREELAPAVAAALARADVVLDIGCGIRPQKVLRPLVHVCCEPHEGYLDRLRESVREEDDRSYVLVKATWAEALRIIPPRSVDTVFLVDVIEHLEKAEARELLKATEALARSQVAVFTPLGFMPQSHPDGRDAWGLDGGAWQEHRSGWEPSDFGEAWDCYACEAFHEHDNMGRPLDPPRGAFWAVRTLGRKGAPEGGGASPAKRDSLRGILDIVIDNGPDFARLSLLLLRCAVRAKNSAPARALVRLARGR